MEIYYNELKNKEVINLVDGSKMGHIVDMVIDSNFGKILGLVVPGEKKIFKKTDDLIIPLEKVRRIGDDVILVRVDLENIMNKYIKSSVKNRKMFETSSIKYKIGNGSYIKYRKLDNKKYK